MTLLWLMLAGGLGALLRFVGDGHIRSKLGRRFPWGTLLINVSGSLLLGTITGVTLATHGSTALKLVLGTGVCGGFTTFSTASFETVRLIEERRWGLAVLLSAGTFGLVLLAASAGLWGSQAIVHHWLA